MGRRHHRAATRGISVAYCMFAYATAGFAAWAVTHFFDFNSPLAGAFAADLAATVLIFLFSMIADNSSIYDPYWSVAPVPIALYWIIHAGGALTARGILVVALILCWSFRLTFNWLVGWRGIEHEDWRYSSFRNRTGRAYWAISFLGFHLMPTLMVFLGLLSVNLAVNSPSPFSPLDAAALVATTAAIIIEAVADKQLKVFRHTRGRDAGTINTGVWRYSRHPTYFGEILFWWGLFLFALAGSINHYWTAVGPLSITLLFRFISVPMMEKHLEERNPGYRKKTACKPALLPLSFNRRKTGK